MSRWVHRLDIKDIWKKLNDGSIQPSEGGQLIAKRIRELRCWKADEELQGIADEFDCIVDEVDINIAMEMLYDWGDTPLDIKFGGKKMCWISTVL